MPPMKDIINLGVGEPDFHTSEHVKEAGSLAIRDNITKYVPQPGFRELREAVAEKFNEENGLSVSADQIVVSYGAKHALFNLFQVLLKPGDEVIILSPHWSVYPVQVEFAKGVPVFVELDEADGYQPDADVIGRACTSKTRALIINSPCNPTGAVFSRQALEAVAELACRRDFLIVTDEVYESILFDGAQHHSIAGFGKDVAGRTVTINSVSKTHAMTGWRVGYGAYPLELAERVTYLQSMSTSGVSGILQHAALRALRQNGNAVAGMIGEYDKRRRYLLDRFEGLGTMSCTKPLGTFYLFVNIKGLIGSHLGGELVSGSRAFCDGLLRDKDVIVSSGEEYGSHRHFRLSFAASMEQLAEAMDRIEEFTEKRLS